MPEESRETPFSTWEGHLAAQASPRFHHFRPEARQLLAHEAAHITAIQDQAHRLLQLIDRTPTGWDQRLSIQALEDSVTRAVRAIIKG